MTTIVDNKIICSVCNHKSTHDKIGSTNFSGSPDLDTRPPERLRSTIIYEIQRCPNCGYCASHLSDQLNEAKEVIASDEYKIQLNNNQFTKIANSFLCSSQIHRKANNLKIAIWNSISAAWICDDQKNSVESVLCRIRALNIIKDIEATGDSFAEKDGSSIAIKVDLMRRSSNFTNALQLIKVELPNIEHETIVKLLNYQKDLIERHDIKRYTIEDVFENGK